MANLLLTISSNPQAFTSGNWPSVEMNGSTWRFTFTFTSSSASGAYAGYHALFTAPNGGNSGGLWIALDTLEFYNLNDDILVTRTMSWSAGATLRLTFNMVAKTIIIGGMTTGNGQVSWSGSGPYFNGSDTLTAGGLVGESGYDIAGTFSNIDDGVDKLTFDPATVSITAADVGLLANRRLVVDQESVTITAADVSLLAARRLTFDETTVDVTAEDVGLLAQRVLRFDSESVVVTPSDVGLLAQRRLAIDTTAVTITTFPIERLSSDDSPERAAENAIWSWVVAGSGLSEGNVIWGRHSPKNGPVPAGTFISMRIIAIGKVSEDWLRSEEVGGDIIHIVEGPRQPTLELTCFAGEPFGTEQAHQILDRVLASIRWPSVRALLRAGNVGVGRKGPIRVVDGARSTMFDPRAIVEVGLHTMRTLADPVAGSSIERALVTVETPETGEVETWVPEPPT